MTDVARSKPPLKVRRNIADVSFLIDIANNRLEVPHLLSQVGLYVPMNSQRKNSCIHFPFTNYWANSLLIKASYKYKRIAKDYDLDLYFSTTSQARVLLKLFKFKFIYIVFSCFITFCQLVFAKYHFFLCNYQDFVKTIGLSWMFSNK